MEEAGIEPDDCEPNALKNKGSSSRALISRLALGLGDDLLTTISLAVPAGVPRLLAPAMNPHMLAAPPIRRHLDTLVEDGWTIVEPEEGRLACGVEGRGRLAEVDALLAAVASLETP